MAVSVAKRSNAKLPRVVALGDGRYAFDVEPGVRIVFWHDGDRCHVRIDLARSSEQARKDG